MDKLEMPFQVEKDTTNTGRYQEEAGSSRPHRYTAAEILRVLGDNLRSEGRGGDRWGQLLRLRYCPSF